MEAATLSPHRPSSLDTLQKLFNMFCGTASPGNPTTDLEINHRATEAMFLGTMIFYFFKCSELSFYISREYVGVCKPK